MPDIRQGAFFEATPKQPRTVTFKHLHMARKTMPPAEGLVAHPRWQIGHRPYSRVGAERGCRFEETKCHFNAQLASAASSVTDTGITATVTDTTIQPRQFKRNRDMHRVALKKISLQNP